MEDFSDIPEESSEQAKMMRNILIARATDGHEAGDNAIYKHLRESFMNDPTTKLLLPSFVRTNRSLSMFWEFIKHKHGTYHERREFIHNQFTPLIEHLSGENTAPSDNIVSEALEAFGVDRIKNRWLEALERRIRDPAGALTTARTLLEDVIKHILDGLHQDYSRGDDLPKLYDKVAEHLNIAPKQHSEETVKSMFGSITNLVNGIGTLRNQEGDAHGRGADDPPPPRELADFAVNTAGILATFLIKTYQEHQASKGGEQT